MNACNSEKLSDLNTNDIERNIPDWVFPTQQNLPTRHQSHSDGVLLCPLKEEAGIWTSNRFPQGTETYIL
jgi:hypothetical protein